VPTGGCTGNTDETQIPLPTPVKPTVNFHGRFTTIEENDCNRGETYHGPTTSRSTR
jgi:hypothetical protein